ncbi:MAG: iron-containing redox enzyme family protein [Burkholderiales bacterium]|nr:iron-containing redox enzyme family protein [Burkholderiales bacterium]
MLRTLYQRLCVPAADPAARAEAKEFLRDELQQARAARCEVPHDPGDLAAWMQAQAQGVHAHYALYLADREAGGARRYFTNRAHALYFLRSVAPTKLVDGAWLYGLASQWRNPRFAGLVRTYVEELGEGDSGKNHVLLYRRLLEGNGLWPLDGLADETYEQGLIQLALAFNAQDFLPEIIGFNLAYEQLPLHLLITAYELNELGIDPYYFTLHVTVDNTDTGHARRACEAALELLPRTGDAPAFWARVRQGSKLGCLGLGTTQAIAGYNAEAEVLRILAHKAPSGHGAHSDYCKVAGRSVNDWLAAPQDMPAFLQALRQSGWIKPEQEPGDSRFWKLLQGPRAQMFGVFSGYELQVIHDWLRGAASVDGRPFDQPPGTRQPTFRAAQKAVADPDGTEDSLDPDFAALKERGDRPCDVQELVEAMSPATHWSPLGLYATRQFWHVARHAA